MIVMLCVGNRSASDALCVRTSCVRQSCAHQLIQRRPVLKNAKPPSVKKNPFFARYDWYCFLWETCNVWEELWTVCSQNFAFFKQGSKKLCKVYACYAPKFNVHQLLSKHLILQAQNCPCNLYDTYAPLHANEWNSRHISSLPLPPFVAQMHMQYVPICMCKWMDNAVRVPKYEIYVAVSAKNEQVRPKLPEKK